MPVTLRYQLAAACLLLLHASVPAFGADTGGEVYPACIYAAEAALGSGDYAAARRWLAAAPAAERGWEWDYLNARQDNSAGLLGSMPARVHEIRLSPDESRLAACCEDGSIAVLDTASGEQLALLTGHAGAVYGLDWSPDGRLLASTSRDTTVRIWDAQDYSQLAVLEGHQATPYSCTFSPDSRRLVTPTWRMESDGPVGHFKVWDLSSYSEIAAVDYTRHPLSSVAFTPDGRHIAVGCWDSQVGIFGTDDWAFEREFLPEESETYKAIDDICISPDGVFVSTACRDKCARVYESASGELLQVLGGFSDAVRSVAFSGDGLSLTAASRDGSIRVWDTLTWPAGPLELLGCQGGVECFVFGSVQSGLAWSAGSNGELRRWQPGHAAAYPAVLKLAESIYGLDWDRDGSLLAAGNGTEILRLTPMHQGDPVYMRMSGHASTTVGIRFSPDHERFISGSNDLEPCIWEAGNILFRLAGHTKSAPFVDWSSTGGYAASASYDGTVRIWDPADGSCRQVLQPEGEADPLLSIAISPDGSMLATGSRSGFLSIWDPLAGRLRGRHQLGHGGLQGLAWAPDGARLAASFDDGMILLVNAADAAVQRELAGHSDMLVALLWHPDGSRIFSCGYDYSLRIWEADSGRELYKRRDLPAQGYAMDLSPDGKQLAVGLTDGTLLLLHSAPLGSRD